MASVVVYMYALVLSGDLLPWFSMIWVAIPISYWSYWYKLKFSTAYTLAKVVEYKWICINFNAWVKWWYRCFSYCRSVSSCYSLHLLSIIAWHTQHTKFYCLSVVMYEWEILFLMTYLITLWWFEWPLLSLNCILNVFKNNIITQKHLK